MLLDLGADPVTVWLRGISTEKLACLLRPGTWKSSTWWDYGESGHRILSEGHMLLLSKGNVSMREYNAAARDLEHGCSPDIGNGESHLVLTLSASFALAIWPR